MNDNALIRQILIGVFVLAAGWGAYHRARAQRVGGSVSRAGEGPLIFASLRLSGLVTWGVVIAYLIDPRYVSFSAIDIPAGLRWLGLALVIAGFAWLSWMFHALGLNVTDTVAVREHGRLVTSGPYRYVRHPMYAGLIPIWSGLTLVTGNAIVAVAGVVAFAILVLRTRIEERNLVARYGDAYRAYQACTGAFFPRW